jgi:hypothetical protein
MRLPSQQLGSDTEACPCLWVDLCLLACVRRSFEKVFSKTHFLFPSTRLEHFAYEVVEPWLPAGTHMPRTRAASGCLLAFPLALFAGSLVGSAPIVMVAPPAIPTRWSASVLQVTGKRGKGKGERESEPEPCCLSREVWGRGSQNHAANRAASPLHSVMSAGGELLHSGIDVGQSSQLGRSTTMPTADPADGGISRSSMILTSRCPGSIAGAVNGTSWFQQGHVQKAVWSALKL